MSTSPESAAVNLLSRWLAGHVGNDELRRGLAGLGGLGTLGPESRELVDELTGALDRAGGEKSGDVERLVRETLEALALGA
jgi:hypothetical protein